jgi:hypothetical protein
MEWIGMNASYAQQGSGQNQLKIYQFQGEKDGDCRLKKENIRPLIGSANPFFYNHNWQESEKTEMAQLSPERFLVIRQSGCLRKHTHLKLNINPPAAKPNDAAFYVTELFNMLNRVYSNDAEYTHYRVEFEEQLVKHVEKNGIRRRFNFPYADYSFICSFDGGTWGATIEFEIVKLLHREEIEYPGIKEYLDDGYYKPLK